MKIRLLVPIIWVLAALSVWGQAFSETYYVRTDGSDTNDGLENASDRAWATIQSAADNAAPGDLILVQPGTYPENVVINSQGVTDAWITLRGEGDVMTSSMTFPGSSQFSTRVYYYTNIENFIFDGNLGSQHGITMRGAGRISIKDSTFRDYSTSVGLRFDNNGWSSSIYINVKGCTFEGNRYGASAWGSGMLDHSLFEDCLFVDNDIGYYASTWGTRYTTFSRSTFKDNDTGILLEGVYWYWLKTHHNTVYRSIFSNNQTGVLIGEEAGGSHSGCAYDNHVINSTFYDNQNAGILVNTNFSRSNGPSAEYLDAQGQTFVNNIFLSNGTYGIDNNVNQTIFASYNLAHDNGIAPGNNAVFDASNNSLTEDPNLVGPDLGDFRLGSGSVCIDAGDPAYDSDPYVVGEHIDIGALEYDNPTPPEIITGLIDAIEDVPESFLKNKNNSLPISKKLYVVLKTIARAEEETDPVIRANLYHASLQKLTHDILPKTDGCAASGAPDSNDWIIDCETQAEFYDPIVSLIAILEAM
ncbi:MAG: right-handed parallel beta-helix repeat-containing protein [Pseudomonadota bacterium]